MRTVLIATLLAIFIGLINFKALPVSWYDLSLAAGSLWAARAQAVIWMLAPVMVALVAWIEIQHLQDKVRSLEREINLAEKRVVARDASISQLHNHIRG